jgi:hypothetical protein
VNDTLKFLKGVILVIIIIGAVDASAASAAEFHSGSTSGTTYLTATQIGTNQIDTEGGNIKCSSFTLTGQYTGTTAGSVNLAATYGGCTAYGLTDHVDMMDCTVLWTTGSNEQHTSCPISGMTIIPTQGGKPVCTVDIFTQTTKMSVSNVAGSPSDLVITPLSSSIAYTVTYPGGTGTKCGTVGAHSDGSYTGSLTVRAYEDAAHTKQVS